MDAQALGRYLCQSREAREMTLEAAEKALKIRRRTLEMFEMGEFTIPDMSPVQIRGFIRNYAQFLGLEEDRVVQYYEAVLTGGTGRRSLIGRARTDKKKNKRDSQSALALPRSSIPIAPRSITDTPPRLPAVPIDKLNGEGRTSLIGGARAPRRTSLAVVGLRLLVAVASLSVIAFVLIQIVQPTRLGEPEANEGIFGARPSTQTYTPPPTLTLAAAFAQPSPTALAIVAVPAGGMTSDTVEGIQVQIEMDQRAWIRVSVDGVEMYSGIARPGELLNFLGAEVVLVNASNAEALSVTFNGARQPVFGDRGQPIDLTFTPAGVQASSAGGFEPTALVPPTPLPIPIDPAGALIAELTPAEPMNQEIDPTPLALFGAPADTTAGDLPGGIPTETSMNTPEESVSIAPTESFTTVPNNTAESPSSLPVAPTPLPGVEAALAPERTAAEATLLPTQPEILATVETVDIVSEGETLVSTTTPGETFTATRVPTNTPLPTATLTPSRTATPLPTRTATLAPTATLTPNPSITPSATAILPPRQTPVNRPPVKEDSSN